MSIISSGNPELDSKMGGGIPSGSLILVEGNSGSGKSVLLQTFVAGVLKDGNRAALFTSEDTVKGFVRQMQSIDLDILDFLLIGRLRVFPVEFTHLREKALSTLMAAIQSRREEVILVDSLTSVVRDVPADKVVNFFENFKRLSGKGISIIVTIHSEAVKGNSLSTLRSMCDAHLIMTAEQDGQRLAKTLQVAKIRGAASATGDIVGFDVEPGWGMRVVPISKARG